VIILNDLSASLMVRGPWVTRMQPVSGDGSQISLQHQLAVRLYRLISSLFSSMRNGSTSLKCLKGRTKDGRMRNMNGSSYE